MLDGSNTIGTIDNRVTVPAGKNLAADLDGFGIV
jgi:hypothetical protein